MATSSADRWSLRLMVRGNLVGVVLTLVSMVVPNASRAQHKGVPLGGGTDVLRLVSATAHDLGVTPPLGETRPFPEGFPEGNIVVDEFDDSLRLLGLRATAAVVAPVRARRGVAACAIGTLQKMAPGDRCNFWISKDRLVSVQWSYKSTPDGIRRVVLDVTGFELAPPAKQAP